MCFAPFVDSVLLIISFAVSIDAVSVDVSPSYGDLSPPATNRTRFGSAFSGRTDATALLYVAVFPFGT